MQFVKPIPFDEAIDKIGSRSPIGAALSSSEWSDVPVALRERAEFSSMVENVRFLQRSKDFFGDYLAANREVLPDGQSALKAGSRAVFVEQLREFALKEGMGPLDDESAGGLQDITSERRLGLIFDTQTQQAGDYGYWRQGMDADVLNEFPAQRFIRVVDVKEPRTSHVQYVDQVYLKTDPIWARVINEDFGVPWGPWAWGCGHDVEDVDRTEAESLGLLGRGQQMNPDIKNFNENLQASSRGLDPDLIEKLKGAFGDQLVIEGDTMRWMNGAEKGPAISLTKPLPFPVPEPDKTSDRTAPVSQALDVRVRGGLREAVNTALAAIDQVHDDGALPTIPVTGSTQHKNAIGRLFTGAGPKGITAEAIGVKASGSWPALTTVHEIGHFLDLEAIGETGEFASRAAHPGMTAVLAAAENTEAISGLRQALINAGTVREQGHYDYLLKPTEIWARAYAQFIAERSGNEQLSVELRRVLDGTPHRQWTTPDFKPVSAAIEQLFQQQGWL